MSLEQKIMEQLKTAMKQKDESALRSLRAIKSEILKAKTEPGFDGSMTADAEIKMLQKMVKQRKDAFDIFSEQGRHDLAQKEQAEIDIISSFLPKQMDADTLRAHVAAIISETGASGPADMGKVMAAATKKLAGQADGKTISTVVKELLQSGI
jgi:uncharacterized protein YqeY